MKISISVEIPLEVEEAKQECAKLLQELAADFENSSELFDALEVMQTVAEGSSLGVSGIVISLFSKEGNKIGECNVTL